MTGKLPLLLALAIGASGCVSLELGRIAREVEREVEASGTAEVGRGFAVSFGGGTIGTSRFVGRLVAPSATEPYRRLSGEVSQVKVARYPLSGQVDGRTVRRPATLDAYEADGWLPLVTVRDEAEAVWVMYRTDAGVLTDLLAVVLAEDELVLTRVRGDLSALVLEAVREVTLREELDGALREAHIVPEPDAVEAVDASP